MTPTDEEIIKQYNELNDLSKEFPLFSDGREF